MNTDYAISAITPFGADLILFDVVDRTLHRYELVMRRAQTAADQIDGTIRQMILAHRNSPSARR